MGTKFGQVRSGLCFTFTARIDFPGPHQQPACSLRASIEMLEGRATLRGGRPSASTPSKSVGKLALGILLGKHRLESGDDLHKLFPAWRRGNGSGTRHRLHLGLSFAEWVAPISPRALISAVEWRDEAEVNFGGHKP